MAERLNITPINSPNLFPSSINSTTGKLLSEKNLSLILRSICTRPFIYASNLGLNDDNFSLNIGQYGVISKGIAIIDGYIVSLYSNTTLLNIPTDLVPFGQVKDFYLVLKLTKQLTEEGNVGNNDEVFSSIAFEFIEEKYSDTNEIKYLYLYKLKVTQNAIDTGSIQDLRVYSPFDISSIAANSVDTTKTLKDVLDFIVVSMRGLDLGTDFFSTSDKTISIEGENGIYDRLKYKFNLPDYPDKPFINEMIVGGNELLYDQGQIVVLNSNSRLPHIILPEAQYGDRGAIFIDPDRRTNSTAYDPENLAQVLYLVNGELYTTAEVNQNSFSRINIKNSSNPSINIMIPSSKKVDTLIMQGTKNVSIDGSSTSDSKIVTIDLGNDIEVKTINIEENIISHYIDPTLDKFSGIAFSNGIKAKNGTFEEDLRVGDNLEVSGDINTSGNVEAAGDVICSGNIQADKVYCSVYNDFAEYYQVEDKNEFEPGDIISYDPYHNCYRLGTMINPELLIGVYSDSYGFITGGDGEDNKNMIPVGLCGRLDVKIYGPIMPGDLITISHIDGVGTKVVNYKPGTIIGKCLQKKDSIGIEKVKMQIMLS